MILSGNRLGIGTLTPSANLHVSGNAIITSSLIIGGTTNPSNSNLHIHGTMAHVSQSFGAGISNISTQSLVTVDTTAGDAAIYLPSAVAHPNHQLTIKRISTANYLYISGAGNLMDNYSVVTFGSGNYTSIDLISDGANWFFLLYSLTCIKIHHFGESSDFEKVPSGLLTLSRTRYSAGRA